MSEQLAVLPFLEENQSMPENLKVIMQTVPVSFETAAELTAQLKALNIAPTRAIYEGYAAIQIALSALGKSYAETADNLSTNKHETILGSVKFDQNGKNIENPYRLHRWQDGTLKPLEVDNNNL
jgi:ABC-type branched-subunit amino acid transport system substrate-binding protein